MGTPPRPPRYHSMVQHLEQLSPQQRDGGGSGHDSHEPLLEVGELVRHGLDQEKIRVAFHVLFLVVCGHRNVRPVLLQVVGALHP